MENTIINTENVNIKCWLFDLLRIKAAVNANIYVFF